MLYSRVSDGFHNVRLSLSVNVVIQSPSSEKSMLVGIILSNELVDNA